MNKETIKHLLRVYLEKYGRAYVNYILGSYIEYVVHDNKIYQRYLGNKHTEIKLGKIDDAQVMDKIDVLLLGVSGVSFNR